MAPMLELALERHVGMPFDGGVEGEGDEEAVRGEVDEFVVLWDKLVL